MCSASRKVASPLAELCEMDILHDESQSELLSRADREEIMTLRTTGRVLGALGVCAALTVCTLYVTKSTAQRAEESQRQAGAMPPRSTASQFRPDTAIGG